MDAEGDSDVPAEPKPPAEPPTPEPGKDTDDAPAPEPEPTPDVDDTPPAEPEKPPVPESQFDKDDEPFLKKMSKEASAHFGKKVANLKQQLTAAQQAIADAQAKLDVAEGKKLPDSWYEHEHAYQLSPQFQEISGKFGEEQRATHFWTEQLRRCKSNASAREGQPFIPYMLPGADGKLVEVTEEQYDAEHEVALNDLRMGHYENQKRLSADAEKIQKEFAQSHKQADTLVRSKLLEHFPWTKDEKHVFQKSYKTILGQVPAAHKNNPFAQFSAALATQLLFERALRQDAEAKIKAANGVQDDQRAAGPIPGRAAAKKSDAAERVYKMDDMSGL